MEQEIDEKTLRKWQYLLLKILVEFDRICRKNNIQYNLAGGTLIGAVRHKGFIPWDDDVDVAMLPDARNRFVEACKTDLSPEFFLQTPETDPQFPFGTKLMLEGTSFVSNTRAPAMSHNGVFIDILGYSNISDNPMKGYVFAYWYHVLRRVHARRFGFKPHPKRLYQRIVLNFFDFLFKPVSTERLGKMLVNHCRRYDNKQTKSVTILGGVWGYKKETHLRETVSNFIEAEFEGHSFFIPRDYDRLLSHQYGNYMELPPESQRHLRHGSGKVDFGKYEEEAEEFLKFYAHENK